MGSRAHRKWRRLVFGLVLTLAASLVLPMGSGLASTTISYPHFQDVSGLNLVGSAAQALLAGQDVLRLTNATGQAGGAFTANQVDPSGGFSTAFAFRFTNPMGCTDSDGVQGADGITFAIVPQNNAVGAGGGGIGYQGLGSSVAVEFDTWNNGGDDGHNGNHVGVNLNGSMSSVARTNIGGAMNDGNAWYAWIDYDATTQMLEVRLSQSATPPPTPVLSYAVDIPAVVGSSTAYVGFTSGTGCAGNYHDLLFWEFEDSGVETCVPGNGLTFGAPLSTSSTAAITAGDTLAIRFSYGDCLLDDSVTVRVRDADTNQLIAGYTLGYDVTYDPATGYYQQDFDTAKHAIGSGRTLKVMIYFGNKLRGTAMVDVN
ncbi:MAG: lectin-like domain-containing protein [Bacillota bacterium]